jgi:hemolysin activation/secretion protein
MLKHLRFYFFTIAALCSGLISAHAQESKTPVAATTPPVYRFARLLVANTEAKAAALQARPEAGLVVVQDLPVLATKEYADSVAKYVGQPITQELVKRLAGDILAYLQKHDRLVAGFVLPTPQDNSNGEVRLAVLVGRYKQLRLQGNRWFSREQLVASLGLKPGDEVRLSTLEEAVNWTNANPFRRIKVLVNDLKAEPGMADLIVNVQERIPVRTAVSYDNTGNDVIGRNHYTASMQFGNLWGLDHQGSYQFTTTDHSSIYQAHSGDYRVPLPWHHYLQLAGAYSSVLPTFEKGLFALKGQNVLANLRYIAPVERAPFSMEFSAGLDFKQTNNNLEYGGEQVRNTKNDVFQLGLGATVVRRDPVGAWVFAANLSLSPGRLGSRNSDAAFAAARPNGYRFVTDDNGNVTYTFSNGLIQPEIQPIGQSHYMYGTLLVQRLTNLPAGFQLFSRGQIQMASANLLSTEQLSIGGQGTVRGYEERGISGDEGCVLSHELQGPEWQKTLTLHGRKLGLMQSRLVAFWDFGKTWYKHSFGTELDPLMSVGLGLRCNVVNNFSLTADYGWQLLRMTPPQPTHSRASIKATMAY